MKRNLQCQIKIGIQIYKETNNICSHNIMSSNVCTNEGIERLFCIYFPGMREISIKEITIEARNKVQLRNFELI